MITNKPLPVLYNIKSESFGCTACYAICSRSAITMCSDEEGFAYPYINEEKCIRCYMCIKVCPIKKCKEK